MGKLLCCCVILAIAAVAVIVIVPSVLLAPGDTFKDTFLKKCLKFPQEEEVCANIWTYFEEAYVGRDKCNISAEDYDRLFAMTPFTHPCGKTMFWSKTYDLVQQYTEKGDCLFTLEDTLLGHLLDQQSWCGKIGSGSTFTENCEDCTNNPVRAFWEKASAQFALHACEDATVMLDGERPEPYDTNSFFGSVEVPNIQPSHVTTLTVVLVTAEDGKNCTCDSLGSLRQDLDHRIGCACTAVAKSHIEKCIVDNTPCGTCW